METRLKLHCWHLKHKEMRGNMMSKLINSWCSFLAMIQSKCYSVLAWSYMIMRFVWPTVLRHCTTFKAIRQEWISLNDILADDSQRVISIVRQLFVLGINCSIFCTGTRSEPINVQHCPGSPLELRRFHFVRFSKSSSPRMLCSNGIETMLVVCTDLLCVVCIGLLSAVNSQLRIQDWVCLGFGKLQTWIGCYRQIIPWLQISWNSNHGDQSKSFDLRWNGSGRLGLLIIFCEYLYCPRYINPASCTRWNSAVKGDFSRYSSWWMFCNIITLCLYRLTVCCVIVRIHVYIINTFTMGILKYFFSDMIAALF